MIDLQYLHQISHKLDRFKKKSQHLYNFRCPYCGDSQKKQSKARGFVYRSKQDYFFKCHNCSKGTSLGKLIEHIDPDLYKRWVVEKFKKGSKKHTEPEFEFKPVRFDDKNLKKLKKLSDLPNHPAYDLFIKKRKLEDHADKFYVTWHFMTWVNSIIPNKFPNIKEDHPRIVIPFFDTSGKMFAFQGRAFGDEEPKAFTSRYDSWRYIDDIPVLPTTLRVLEKTLDMRVPLTFTIDDCDMIASIIEDEIQAFLPA